MDNQTKTALTVWASTIAGGAGGWWATQQICKSLGVSVNPWGQAAGGLLGAIAATVLVKNMMGDSVELPVIDPEEL